jgi:hypothetical protein
MTKLKNVVRIVAVLALVYVLAWVFGEHGHTYTLERATKSGNVWTCPPSEDEDGPHWDNGKDRDPVCHIPVRLCPSLWFPYATVIPCPYKDPLGGPWTADDLFVLEQMKHPHDQRSK